MGLAASQARFLAITSRKMNCEFQSMQIAQDKLSVTRDMQKATQDYQASLSKTKLVWNAEGNTDGGGEVHKLDYNTMMLPSTLNLYNPYLITEPSGRIVLDSTMKKIAIDAGIAADGTTTPNKDGRNEFLDALQAAGYIDAITNRSIQGNYSSDKTALEGTMYKYSPELGLGEKPRETVYSNVMNTNSFIDYLKNAKEIDIADGSESGAKIGKLFLAGLIDETNGSMNWQDNTDLDKNHWAVTGNDLTNMNLGEILTGNYTINFYISNAAYPSDQHDGIVNGILDNLVNKLVGEGTYRDSDGVEHPCDGLWKILGTDARTQQALKLAAQDTKSIFKGGGFTNGMPGNPYKIYPSEGQAALINGITKSNVVKFGTAATLDIKGDSYSISITNVLKTLLTNFALNLDGFDQDYSVKKAASESKYVTSDLAYLYDVKVDTANNCKIEEKTIYTAQFYNMLYNQLCANGYSNDETRISLIKDEDYLAHALKNGQLFISSLNDDGYYYQDPYTLNGFVAEVPDEDAIVQAELEYKIIKSKLDYKEESLDLDLKNVDTELSALTTEYDTVKNLISKNVEKIFTMFSS